jgi:hypothetical protein
MNFKREKRKEYWKDVLERKSKRVRKRIDEMTGREEMEERLEKLWR